MRHGWKLGRNRHPAGYALVGVAAMVTLRDGGVVQRARVAMTGYAAYAARLTSEGATGESAESGMLFSIFVGFALYMLILLYGVQVTAAYARLRRRRPRVARRADVAAPEWVIVEHDKLAKVLDNQGASASEALEAIAGGDFEFDISEETGEQETADISTEVEDAPVVRFLQKMLIDAINARASDLHFEPYEYNYRVRFRIDGELREIASPPVAIKDNLDVAGEPTTNGVVLFRENRAGQDAPGTPPAVASRVVAQRAAHHLRHRRGDRHGSRAAAG